MKSTFKSKEQIKEEITVLDYALSNNYKIDKEKSTQSWLKLESTTGDRIMISAKKNLYYNLDYPQDKGDIFHFACNRIHGNLSIDTSNEAFYKALINLNKHLGNYLQTENNNAIKEKDKFLAKKEKLSSLQSSTWNHKPIEDYTYLIKDRAIAVETLKDPLFEGRLFNTYFQLASGHLITNFAFGKFAKDELVGLEVRNKTIKTILGNDTGIFYTNIKKNAPIDGVFYAESGIDIASCIEILKGNPQFDHSKNYLFLSFTGNLYEAKINQIISDLEKLQITPATKFLSLTDNDFDKEENKKKGKDYDVMFTAAIINKYQTPLIYSSNDVYYNYTFGLSSLTEKNISDFQEIITIQNKAIDTLYPSEERYGKYLMLKEHQNINQLTLYIPKNVCLNESYFTLILKAINSEHLYIPHKPKLVNDWNDELKRKKGVLIVEKKNILLNTDNLIKNPKKNTHGRTI